MDAYNSIKKLIAQGQLKTALDKTYDSVHSNNKSRIVFNKITSIFQRFSTLEHNKNLGIISNDDYTLHRNRITKDLLDFLDWSLDYETETSLGKENNILSEKEKFLQKQKEIFYDDTILCKGEDLNKRYSNNSTFHLKDVNIVLKPRKITAVIGKNAAGKTTLLQIIAGILAKTSGGLTYPTLNKKNRVNWIKIKSQIAYIPQTLTTWKGNLKDNLHFTAATKGIKGEKNNNEVTFILTRLELNKFANHHWHELSGGYKMRFELAKALVWKPSILIMDEPLAHLDVKARIQFLNDIKTLCEYSKKPFSVLISSQNIHEIEKIADRIIFFKEGNVLFNGTKAEIAKFIHSRLFEITFNIEKGQDKSNIQLSILNWISTIIKTELIKAEFDEFDNTTLILETVQNYTLDRMMLDISAIASQHSISYIREITNSAKKYFYESNN